MNEIPSAVRDALWRRKLTEAERAQLPAQPDLELDARLTGALAKTPNVPVPSNFTARVLDAIDREEAAAARPRIWALNWRSFLPRVAVVAVALIVAGLSVQRYETVTYRASLARTVAMVTTAPPPSVDALENLDAIQRMGQSAHADGDLLADLQ